MAEPLRLPVAEYAPDLPDFPGAGSAVVKNVYPKTANSYGAIGAPAARYTALGARCQGGAAYRDNLGNVFIFAGDIANLYLLKAGLTTWQNVSGGAYSAVDQTWRFAYFNGDVIATNFGNNPQAMTLIGGANFADLSGTPPRGKHIAVVKNAFLVFGNTYDSTNGNMPQRVWWSAAGNHRDWPILGTQDAAQKQSNAVDLLGPGGAVQGFAPHLISADAVVFQEYAVARMTYVGPPSVFSFLPVENARGCLAPDSIVVNGGTAYYWGQDGLYAFDGGESRPIGANKVDKFLLGEGATGGGDADLGNIGRVVGMADPLNKLIWWAYPSRQNSLGNPDRLLAYNWQLDRFSLAEVTCETLLRLMSIGYTLDQLSTIFGYTIDTVPAPFDSPIWLGGFPQLGLFDADHKLASLTGPRLAATVDTAELQPAPGRRLLLRGVRPLVDGLNTAPTVAIGHRERLQDGVTWTPAAPLNSLGVCPLRSSGHYVRSRITVPAGDPNWQHISGVELDAVAQGGR